MKYGKRAVFLILTNLPGDRKEPFHQSPPPPNVTGVLHLGHAYEDTLQDAIIRYKRMKGFRALWIPGHGLGSNIDPGSC